MKNKVYIGSLTNPSYYFENEDIINATAVQNVSLIGQELSVDTFTPTVQDQLENLMDVELFRSSDGQYIETGTESLYAVEVGDAVSVSNLIYLDFQTPVWFYQDDVLIGKFYVNSVKRVGANAYAIDATSAIGILSNMYHGGGLFTSTTFGAVLRHILATNVDGTGASVIQYEIDEDVDELPVSGWLPYATKRENLYQLVFANGVNIIKNVDGNPRFTFIYTSPTTPEEIDEDGVYMDGSMDYSRPYSKISVLEHTYTEPASGTAASTLFDNTNGTAVVSQEVRFSSAPIVVSSLVATGLTLVSANENYAVVSGTGTLTGIPYQQSAKEMTYGDQGSTEENTISVQRCTMVNTLNSQNLLERLFAFYCPSTRIQLMKGSIVHSGERCGKIYEVKNAFKETVNAFMSSMTFTVSSFNKADVEMYAGYEPAGQRGLYQHVIVLDADTYAEDEGTFTVPDGVTEMKVVMIGGGTGGSSGYPGKNGKDSYCRIGVDDDADISGIWYGAEGGDGGAGGSGGAPGRVNVVVIQNPSATYSYTIGTGGEGGAATGFIPDTETELRATLRNEHPETEYTQEQINTMLATEQSLSGWNGSPNAGSSGTATTFGEYSTTDQDSYVPTGGVYEPITNRFFAVTGNNGLSGGKGGARKITTGDTFNWVTDGESVQDNNGTVYHGGTTGRPMTTISGLSEARFTAYGGNGAGAAVGIDRGTSTHMNGGSDQSASWVVTEDE